MIFFKLTQTQVNLAIGGRDSVRQTRRIYSGSAILALLATLGCSNNEELSSVSNQVFTSSSSQDFPPTLPLKETIIAVSNDQGIKIFYNLWGSVEFIQVTGIAESWKGDVNIRAETDAKERLVKYLYGEQIDVQASIERTTKIFDKATDEALKLLSNGQEPPKFIEIDAEDVVNQLEEHRAKPINRESIESTNQRAAERAEEEKLATLTSIRSSGTLRGLRLIEGQFQNDGEIYVAVYQWSEKDLNTANEIRTKMLDQ